jgi:hypothetical protein
MVVSIGTTKKDAGLRFLAAPKGAFRRFVWPSSTAIWCWMERRFKLQWSLGKTAKMDCPARTGIASKAKFTVSFYLSFPALFAITQSTLETCLSSVLTNPEPWHRCR